MKMMKRLLELLLFLLFAWLLVVAAAYGCIQFWVNYMSRWF